MRKSNLSFDYHKAAGKILHRIRDELVGLTVKLSNSKDCKASSARLSRACGMIDKERSELEEIMFTNCKADLPGGNDDLKIYYPGGKSQRSNDENHN